MEYSPSTSTVKTLDYSIDAGWVMTCVVRLGIERSVVIERLEIKPRGDVPSKMGIVTSLLRRVSVGDIRRQALLEWDEAAVFTDDGDGQLVGHRGRPPGLTRSTYKKILRRAITLQRNGVTNYAQVISNEMGVDRGTVRSWICRARKMLMTSRAIASGRLSFAGYAPTLTIRPTVPTVRRRKRSAHNSAHR
jgi:hypothetical protein